MAKEEYEEQGILEPKRKRLDRYWILTVLLIVLTSTRCFFTPDTIEPISMKLLGTTPYANSEYISDHYGILVKLRIK
jgi:hypothetical protein